jgi:hypothetical protein
MKFWNVFYRVKYRSVSRVELLQGCEQVQAINESEAVRAIRTRLLFRGVDTSRVEFKTLLVDARGMNVDPW